MTALVETIIARRSVSPRHQAEPGPTGPQLLEMARAACAGIDHGRMSPARFIHITDACRANLADAFGRAADEADPDSAGAAARRQAARERATTGPCLVAVVARIDPAHAIPEHEQWIAVGAALQNFMLGAHGLGFSGKMVSGKRVASAALRSFFELETHEHLVGFVALGTAARASEHRERKMPEEILTKL